MALGNKLFFSGVLLIILPYLIMCPVCISEYSLEASIKDLRAVHNESTNPIPVLKEIIANSSTVSVYFTHFMNDTASIVILINNSRLTANQVKQLNTTMNIYFHRVLSLGKARVLAKYTNGELVLHMLVLGYMRLFAKQIGVNGFFGHHVSLYHLLPSVIYEALKGHDIRCYILAFEVPHISEKFIREVRLSLSKYSLSIPIISVVPHNSSSIVRIMVSNIIFDDYMYRLLLEPLPLFYLLLSPYVVFYVPSQELEPKSLSLLLIDIRLARFLCGLVKEIHIRANLPLFINITGAEAVKCKFMINVLRMNDSQIVELDVKNVSEQSYIVIKFIIISPGIYCCRPYNITSYLLIDGKPYIVQYDIPPYVSPTNSSCFIVEPKVPRYSSPHVDFVLVSISVIIGIIVVILLYRKYGVHK